MKLLVQARPECFFSAPEDIQIAYKPSLECLKRLRFRTGRSVNIVLRLGDYDLSITLSITTISGLVNRLLFGREPSSATV